MGRERIQFSPAQYEATRRQHLLAMGVLLVLVAVFFAKILASGQVIYGWDIVNEKYYWRRWAFWELMSRGRMPLWNPHMVSGYAFAADPIQMIFYPLNFVFALLPTRLAFTVSFMMHFWMLGFFMYLFLRSLGKSATGALIGGVAVAFSATMVGHVFLGDHPHLAVISWFPMALFLIERAFQTRQGRYYIWLAIVNAMGFIGGHPQFTFYFFVGSGTYFLFRWLVDIFIYRQWKWAILHGFFFCLCLMLGAVLAGVTLAPEVESILFSNKKSGFPEHIANMFSYPPEHLITYLAPWFYGDLVSSGFWAKGEYNVYAQYVGILPLALAVLAIVRERDRYIWFFLGLSVAVFLYSMGHYTIVFHYIFKYAPGFDKVRFPPRSMFIVIITLGLLAAYGWDEFARMVRRGDPKLKRFFKIIFAVLGVSAVLWGVCFAFKSALIPLWKQYIVSVVFNIPTEHTWGPELRNPRVVAGLYQAALGSFGHFVVILGLAAALLWALARKKPGKILFGGLGILFIFANLFWYGYRYLIPIPENNLLYEAGVTKFLQNHQKWDGPFRIFTLMPLYELNLPPRIYEFYSRLNEYNQSYINRGMVEGVSHFGGELGLLNQRYVDLAAMPGEEFTYAIYKLLDMDIMNLMNVRYVLVPKRAVTDRQNYILQAPEFERLAPEWYIKRLWDHTIAVPEGDYDSQLLEIRESPLAFPRAYVAHRWELMDSDEAIRHRLFTAGPVYRNFVQLTAWAAGFETLFGIQGAAGSPVPWTAAAVAMGAVANCLNTASPFDHWAVLDAGVNVPKSKPGSLALAYSPPRILRYSPNEVWIQTEDPRGGMLILLDSFYPGWKAYVDGDQVKIFRANYVFRAVPLPAGRHRIVFRYQPWSLMIGLIMSIGGIMFTAGVLILTQVSKPARRADSGADKFN